MQVVVCRATWPRRRAALLGGTGEERLQAELRRALVWPCETSRALCCSALSLSEMSLRGDDPTGSSSTSRLIWEFPLSHSKDLQVAALSLSIFFFCCGWVLLVCFGTLQLSRTGLYFEASVMAWAARCELACCVCQHVVA